MLGLDISVGRVSGVLTSSLTRFEVEVAQRSATTAIRDAETIKAKLLSHIQGFQAATVVLNWAGFVGDPLRDVATVSALIASIASRHDSANEVVSRMVSAMNRLPLLGSISTDQAEEDE